MNISDHLDAWVLSRRKAGLDPTPPAYRGVRAMANTVRYRAVLALPGGTSRHLGMFDTAEQAARAHDAAAREAFGDEAKVNFPDDGGLA